MHTSRYILELETPIETAPRVDGYSLEVLDAKTLAANVPTSLGIHALFEKLSEQGIRVHGLRNAANRLEQLFLDLVEDEPR
jgi:ABC-2 type transport system ATP-binding protein